MSDGYACEQLTIHRGGSPVLQDVTLSIAAGECVALIGPNGAGKTTLLLALLGLLKPTAGRVTRNGQRVHRLSPTSRGRFAAYVPQTVSDLPGFSVYDVVAGGRYPYARTLHALSTTDRAAIDAALDAIGLTPLAARAITTLSGGERQKVFLAAAIAQDAQVLLLDEPTTALDPSYQVELLGALKQWRQRGRGIILVSHDLQVPAVLAERVIALKGGRLHADDPAAAGLAPDRLEALYGNAFDALTTPDGRTLPIPHWPR